MKLTKADLSTPPKGAVLKNKEAIVKESLCESYDQAGVKFDILNLSLSLFFQSLHFGSNEANIRDEATPITSHAKKSV